MSQRKLEARKNRQKAERKKSKALKKQENCQLARRQQKVDYLVSKKMKAPGKQVVNDPNSPIFSKQLTADEIRARLEHNLEILKALEEEYDKEMASKAQTNEELEGKGYETLKEKMDALMGEQKDRQIGFGGSAEVTFTPKTEKVEVGGSNPLFILPAKNEETE